MDLSNIVANSKEKGTAENYLAQKYPIAGGLTQAVFGGNQETAPGAASTMVAAPLPQMPGQPSQDSSMIAMNAQPKQGGGGLETLVKLFMGG